MDKKPGRFFEDQPDVNDDYQIHFLYTLAKDGEDREWDINGKMEAMLLEMNEIMARETEKKSKGESKKYKFDYRKDGKLDITFLRLDKNFKDLDRKSSINNNISAFLWLKRLNNPKKIYFSLSFNLSFINHKHIKEGITIKAVRIKNIPQSPFNQSTRAPDDDASVVLPAVPIDASKAY